MESSIEDYRTIDGVNIPHGGRTCVLLRRKRSEGGTGTRILELVWTLEEVDCNFKGLSMECFLPPGDLKKEEEGGCGMVTNTKAKLPFRILSSSRIRASKIAAIDVYDDDSESSGSSEQEL